MVDLPDPGEPTMNVFSVAGRKMKTLERTGMVGRDGYAQVTSWGANLPERLDEVIVLRTRRVLDCGVEVAREMREMRETIENFPLARMMTRGMHVCMLLIAIRPAQMTAITSPVEVLSSLTS